MDLEQFLSRHSDSFSAAFNSRHVNQNLSDEVRELAHMGLKLFPVSLAAKLAGDPDRWIADATDDILLLEELVAAQPLWGYRLALGPSGLCILVLDGAVGRASFATLVPDLEECPTLQARRGDVMYAFFRQPVGIKVTGSAKLAPGVSILGDGESWIVPPAGGMAWVNPNTEIETLPHSLRLLLGLKPPDNTPGCTMPAPKPFPRPSPCRSTESLLQRHRAARRGFSNSNQARWNSGYHI